MADAPAPLSRDLLPEPSWEVAAGPVAYPEAIAAMEARAAAIRAGEAGELVWLVEHPPLYTAGTSADPAELLARDRLPVFTTGRGGRYTYHGPGQRVGYVMLDLDARGRDVRRFVASLEQWLIDALAMFGVPGRSVSGRIGIWVDAPRGEAKIGAIGVRVRRWVTLHGFALNIDPDLAHFAGIVPCGIADHGVTSLADLGVMVTCGDVDDALNQTFPNFLARLGGAGRYS